MPAPITPIIGRGMDANRRGKEAMGGGAAIASRKHEGPVLNTLQAAGHVGDGFFMADFMLPMVATVAAWTVGKLPVIGPRIQLWTDAVLRAPLTAAKAVTIGEMAANINVLPAAYFKEMAGLTGRLPSASEKFMARAEALGGISNVKTAHLAGTSGAFGNGALQRFAASRASGGLAAMAKEADRLIVGLSEQGGGLLSKVGGFFGKAQAEATGGHPFTAVEEALGKFKAALAGPAHAVDIAHAKGHLDVARAALSEISGASVYSKKAAMLEQDIIGFGQRLDQVGSHIQTARGNQNLLQAATSAGKNMSPFNLVFKGGMAAGATYYTGRTIVNFKQAVSSLQELHKDLTGESISFFNLMSGNHLSPMMQAARSNMLKRFVPEALSAVASAGLNILWMKRHMGMKEHIAMGAAMLTQMSVNELMPKENFLETYLSMKDLQKAGQNVPAEAYSLLVEAASHDAQQIGGVDSRLVQSIGVDYAKEQKPVAEVLKEIQAKQPYLERAQRLALSIKESDEAAKAGAPAENTTPPAPASPMMQAGKGAALMAAQHDGKMMQQHQELAQ